MKIFTQKKNLQKNSKNSKLQLKSEVHALFMHGIGFHQQCNANFQRHL
jgi:hypothetical protein